MHERFAIRLAQIYLNLHNEKSPQAAALWASRLRPSDAYEVANKIRELLQQQEEES